MTYNERFKFNHFIYSLLRLKHLQTWIAWQFIRHVEQDNFRSIQILIEARRKIMKNHLFIISSIGFLLLAPGVQREIYGISHRAACEGVDCPSAQHQTMSAETKLATSVKTSITQALNLDQQPSKLRDFGVWESLDDNMNPTGGIQLGGKVDSVKLKSDIGEIAKKVPGVKVNQFQNNLEVVSSVGAK